MIKKFLFYATWRKKDVEFFKSLDITVEEGCGHFLLEENERYFKVKEYLSRKGIFNKPPADLFTIQSPSEFSKEELDASSYYILNNMGYPKGYPQPEVTYKQETYNDGCARCGIDYKQISSFRIKSEPNWTGKTKLNFSLNWIFDETFIKKDFFQEVFEPLGLKSREVIIHKTGKPAETAVQLIIPEAKSKLELEGSSYDTQSHCPVCGIKKYDQRNLDFMPRFKEDFDFIICKTQEVFGETNTHRARRKIIINKDFCKLLVNKGLIKYNSNDLIPMLST